jgi:hypothetical protein
LEQNFEVDSFEGGRYRYQPRLSCYGEVTCVVHRSIRQTDDDSKMQRGLAEIELLDKQVQFPYLSVLNAHD